MSERAIRRGREREIARARRRTGRHARRVAVATGVAVASTAVLGSSAEAATFEVTSAADSGPNTLRQAVEDANSAPSDDSIVFASTLSGDTINLTSDEIPIYLGTGYGDLSIEGLGAEQLAVSGNDTTGIFFAYDEYGEGALSISDLTLEHAGGAGMYTAITSGAGQLSVSDTVLTENESSKYGGALVQVGGSATLDNVTITDNSAEGIGGGAFIVSSEPSSIVDSTITGNAVEGSCACPTPTAGGGLVLLQYPGTGGAEIERTTIADNRVEYVDYAALGGGLFSVGDVTLSDSEITGNSTEGPGGGGGVYSQGKYTYGLTIVDSTVAGNSSGEGAGGVQLDGAATISRSTISGNEGGVGGIAAYDYACSCGPLTPDEALLLSNTTVSGNTATGSSTTPGYRTGYGGGVYLHGQVGGTIRNSTIVDNTAEAGGGGVFSYAGDYGSEPVETRNISSTVIADNTAAGGADDLGTHGVGGVGFSAGFSLIQTPGSADLVSDPAGSNIFGADAELGPLADNGGPTLTHRPAPRSPVIDQGTANGLAVDQRGEPRTSDRPPNNADDGTDIGSVELPGDVEPPITTITSGPAENSSNPNHVTLGFSANEPASFECELDGGGFSACGSPKSYENLAAGAHTFRVRATDEAGTVGPAVSRSFFVADCNGIPATIVAEPGAATHGSDDDDVIVGTSGPDEIHAKGGDDIVCANGGDDLVHAGGGDDAVTGNGGDDELRGDGGADELYGAVGDDLLQGGVEDDLLDGGAGADELFGRDGDDTLHGRGGPDLLRGNAGADFAGGGPGGDDVRGGKGPDDLRGGKGRDDLRGAKGDDEIRGATENDGLRGGKGDDFLNGGKGRNKCNGGSGVNVLRNCS